MSQSDVQIYMYNNYRINRVCIIPYIGLYIIDYFITLFCNLFWKRLQKSNSTRIYHSVRVCFRDCMKIIKSGERVRKKGKVKLSFCSYFSVN